jgi:hypothetical protein
MGDDPRLARASASEHEKRAIAVLDGFALRAVQTMLSAIQGEEFLQKDEKIRRLSERELGHS